MDYNEIRKLDEDTSKDLQESKGPVDECMCKIFTSPPGSKPSGKGVKSSLMKVFGSIGKSKTGGRGGGGRGGGGRGGGVGGGGGAGGGGGGGKSITIPLGAVAPRFIHTTRRPLNWKKGDCGKCGCDSKQFFLKDSDLTIKITTPDISLDALCPCKQNCMPDKAKLKDNIKVTIEHAEAPVSDSVWNQQAIEFDAKTIKSCIELANPVKTAEHDKLPAIELIKSIHRQPSIYGAKRDALALQKLPSVSIGSGSINSNIDETSDVVVLVDDDYYDGLFKNSAISKDMLLNVIRSRSHTG